MPTVELIDFLRNAAQKGLISADALKTDSFFGKQEIKGDDDVWAELAQLPILDKQRCLLKLFGNIVIDSPKKPSEKDEENNENVQDDRLLQLLQLNRSILLAIIEKCLNKDIVVETSKASEKKPSRIDTARALKAMDLKEREIFLSEFEFKTLRKLQPASLVRKLEEKNSDVLNKLSQEDSVNYLKLRNSAKSQPSIFKLAKEGKAGKALQILIEQGTSILPRSVGFGFLAQRIFQQQFNSSAYVIAIAGVTEFILATVAFGPGRGPKTYWKLVGNIDDDGREDLVTQEQRDEAHEEKYGSMSFKLKVWDEVTRFANPVNLGQGILVGFMGAMGAESITSMITDNEAAILTAQILAGLAQAVMMYRKVYRPAYLESELNKEVVKKTPHLRAPVDKQACDLMFVDAWPEANEKNKIILPFGKSNTAYVVTKNNEIYYVNKNSGKWEQLKVSPDKVQQLKEYIATKSSTDKKKVKWQEIFYLNAATAHGKIIAGLSANDLRKSGGR